jgi:hypothetical protein
MRTTAVLLATRRVLQVQLVTPRALQQIFYKLKRFPNLTAACTVQNDERRFPHDGRPCRFGRLPLDYANQFPPPHRSRRVRSDHGNSALDGVSKQSDTVHGENASAKATRASLSSTSRSSRIMLHVARTLAKTLLHGQWHG